MASSRTVPKAVLRWIRAKDGRIGVPPNSGGTPLPCLPYLGVGGLSSPSSLSGVWGVGPGVGAGSSPEAPRAPELPDRDPTDTHDVPTLKSLVHPATATIIGELPVLL